MKKDKPEPTAGYEGILPDEDSPTITYTTHRLNSSSALIMMQVRRNDIPVGILYLPNEEEYEWLSKSVNAVEKRQRPKQK